MSRQGSMFKITITLLIVGVVIVYTVFNSRFLFKGPDIQLFNVVHGQTVEEEMFEITGKAENVSFISLNGRPIFIDQEHVFKEKVLLTNKINPINIYAKDKFGKEITKEIVLIYENDNHAEEQTASIDKANKEILEEDKSKEDGELSEDEETTESEEDALTEDDLATEEGVDSNQESESGESDVEL